MPNEAAKHTVGTGTVVDSLPPEPPVAASVTSETQIQEDRAAKPAGAPPDASLRYVLKDEIGRGGMGVVYYARDTTLNRDVAVKVLQDRYKVEGSVAARFFEEARITGQLQHHGIPPVHDLGTLPDGRPFMAMKLIRGRTLSTLLASPDRPDAAVLLDYFGKICDTVAYAHAKHVIHRDLKPSNVMVGQFGEVQVMDWGLAKVVSGGFDPTATMDGSPPVEPEPESDAIHSERSPDTQTQAGAAMGTPAFMPPEQAKGDIRHIGTRADVFCLGGILCEMLTGRPTYTGVPAEVRAKAALGHLDETVDRLDSCGADPELVAIAKGCLKADRLDRPPDGRAVADAVAAYRYGLDARRKQAEIDRAKAETLVAESGKRARLRLILVGLGLVLVLVATVYNFRLGRANEDARKANEDARTANEEAGRANLEAKANNALTEEAIDQFVAELRDDDRLKKYDDLRDVRRKLFETAVAFNRKLLDRGGDEPRLRFKRAEIHLTLGLLYAELEDPPGSAAEFRLAKDEFARLHATAPADERALAGLATATNRLGNAYERLSRRAGPKADPSHRPAAEYEEAIRLRRQLVQRNPSEENRLDLATSMSNLAVLDSVRPEVTPTRADPSVLFREAEDILTPLVTGPSPSLRAERQFARLQTNIATHFYLGKRVDAAFEKAITTAKDTFVRMVNAHPDRDDIRFDYVLFADRVGMWWLDLGRLADSESWLTLAVKECGIVVDAHPGVRTYRKQFADTLLNRAIAANEMPMRKEEVVVPLFQAAMDQVHRLDRDRPGLKEVWVRRKEIGKWLSAVLTDFARTAEAVGVWDESLPYAPPEARKGIELRRELARGRGGDVAAAWKFVRPILNEPPATAEECVFLAGILSLVADSKWAGKEQIPADDLNGLRGRVKSLLTAGMGLPDFGVLVAEISSIPTLKPYYDAK